MYNHSTILGCLRGLIGFESSYYSEHPTLDADLQASTSGVLVGPGLHPLFTYENILAVAEQFSSVNVRVAQDAVSYPKGSIVKETTDIWQAKVDSVGKPSSTPANWNKTNLLSAYLRRLYDTSSLNLFRRMFTQKKVNEVAKTLLADISLYSGIGNISNRITKNGRFVGFKITIRHHDTAAVLSYIGVQVDQAQSDLKVFLYHSSSDVPVQTFTLDHTRAVQFQWHKLDAVQILSYMDDNIYPGGSWYLGYYENQWLGDAIRKDISFNGKYNCGTCSEAIVNARMYDKWSTYLSIQPFYVNSSGIDPITFKLWDETNEILLNDYTWGLNLQMSIRCDVSNWICKNSTILTDAISKQITVDLLSEMAFSLRDNQKKEKIAGLAAIALDNQEHGQQGEAQRLQDAIDAVSFDFSGMNSVCLPCNTHGYQLRSVWK
jgi:hypothetical protein